MTDSTRIQTPSVDPSNSTDPPVPVESESESESGYETESDVEIAMDGAQPEEFDQIEISEDEITEDHDFPEDLDFNDFQIEDDNLLENIGDIAGSLFATDEGDTVCTALVQISKQLELQNKIMVKILTQLQK